MNIVALIALSFGMSMDAFAVSISRGASLPKSSLAQALKIGLGVWFDGSDNATHWLFFWRIK